MGGPGWSGWRTLVEWLMVAAITAVVVGWLALGTAADRANHLVYDALIRAQGRPADSSIVVIAIDDRSLRALGRWPWSRMVHAGLIDRLSQTGPRAVAYDVLFPETAADDPALASALSRAGNVHLPQLLDAPGDDGAPWRAVPPAAPLAAAAAGLGHVNLTVDGDGVVRRLPLYMRADGRVWPHLMTRLAGARGAAPPPPPAGRSDPALTAVAVEAVAYAGPPGAYRTVSFSDVLNGEVPDAFLRDKLVLVGATAPGLGDRYATPSAARGELSPGIEIQAALLQTLLEGGGSRTLSPPWLLALSLLPLALLVGGFLVLRPLANMIAGAILILSTLAASVAAFLLLDVWAPPAAAIAGLALAYPLWSWRRLAVASAYMQSEVEAFQRDGSPLPAAALTPLRLEGDVVAKQVIALRAAVKQLRDLDRFISDALRSLPDATVVIDAAGRVLLANDRARDLFGEALKPGAPMADLFLSLGEPSWRRFLVQDDDHGDIIGPAGQVLKVASAALADAEGRASGHIVRFADMSRIRAAERQREQALQLLSHDMRAPQVSILTLLEGGQDRADPAFERRIADYARQTLDLAESYVQLARAESQPYRAVVLDLGQLMQDAADTLWPQAAEKGVTIETPSGEDEYLVEGDPGLLRRLLVNLLDNAVKYGPRGESVSCLLSAETQDGAPVCVARIRDRGPGLSPEAVRRLFQPFGHGDADHRGAGLGLAFVRTVAQRHGGHVRYQSDGSGATFVLTLPRFIEAEATT